MSCAGISTWGDPTISCMSLIVIACEVSPGPHPGVTKIFDFPVITIYLFDGYG